jgi:hypothetical protein
MTDPRRARAEWADLRAIRGLIDRVLRSPRVPPTDAWGDGPLPVLGAHWPLADHDWHRRRTWRAGGREQGRVDHQATRYALLPDGRLVRAVRQWSETWDGDESAALQAQPVETVRAMTVRDVLVLDRRAEPSVVDRGTTRTWGVQPAGEPPLPWPGAGIEALLKALIG